jgi:hypothetical protein
VKLAAKDRRLLVRLSVGDRCVADPRNGGKLAAVPRYRFTGEAPLPPAWLADLALRRLIRALDSDGRPVELPQGREITLTDLGAMGAGNG